MILLPAIDLIGGKVVRLTRGDYARATVYGDDPLAVALSFRDAGAEHLHVVDLEGARDIHEASIAFQREVRSMYLAQTQLDRQFLRIDCANANGEMLPPGAIFAKVRGVIDPYLR